MSLVQMLQEQELAILSQDRDEYPETEIMEAFKPRVANVVSSKNTMEKPCFELRDLIMEKRVGENKIESKVKIVPVR